MANVYEAAVLSTPETSTDNPDLADGKRRRRQTVRVACNTCRTKKTRCDGRRPLCGWCASHPGLHCVYDTETSEETRSAALKRENDILKRNLDRIEGLLHDLTSLPEPQSMELLKRMRLDANSTPSYGHPGRSNPVDHGESNRPLPSIHVAVDDARQPVFDASITPHTQHTATRDARVANASENVYGASRYYFVEEQGDASSTRNSDSLQDTKSDQATQP